MNGLKQAERPGPAGKRGNDRKNGNEGLKIAIGGALGVIGIMGLAMLLKGDCRSCGKGEREVRKKAPITETIRKCKKTLGDCEVLLAVCRKKTSDIGTATRPPTPMPPTTHMDTTPTPTRDVTQTREPPRSRDDWKPHGRRRRRRRRPRNGMTPTRETPRVPEVPRPRPVEIPRPTTSSKKCTDGFIESHRAVKKVIRGAIRGALDNVRNACPSARKVSVRYKLRNNRIVSFSIRCGGTSVGGKARSAVRNGIMSSPVNIPGIGNKTCWQYVSTTIK